jgi:uncharacterized protein YijF (DUF1287 family)
MHCFRRNEALARRPLLLLASGLILISGCQRETGSAVGELFADPEPPALIAQPRTAAEKIVNGAKAEVRRGVRYDARYVSLSYPGGDVPADRGACTDVIVRALRHAGYDLQRLIHEDMRRHFALYPQRYGLRGPDRSIDHRRTPNQTTFLRRHGLTLPTATGGRAAATWQPGDLVYWDLGNGTGHCGVLSNDRNGRGLPLVIHNLGGARQEDCLARWEITGHFRYPVPTKDRAGAGIGATREPPPS